jgi:predicted transcriptional regulator
MDTRKPSSTSEMQVTSIRLEAELKERLRELSGEQGYQTLIRQILWQFVERQTIDAGLRSLPRLRFYPGQIFGSHLRRSLSEKSIALTGQLIQPQRPMRLGLTITGKLVPLSA